MQNMLVCQHTDIKDSFQFSVNRVDHRVNNDVYKELRYFVARNALTHVWEDMEILRSTGGLSVGCGCRVRRTHGLPCFCELTKYRKMNVPIPLSAVHHHWQRLSFHSEVLKNTLPPEDVDPEPYFDEVRRILSTLDRYGRRSYMLRFHEFIYPDTNSMVPPKDKINTKGAKKRSRKEVAHEKSTRRDPSKWEFNDFDDTPKSKRVCSQPSSSQPKGNCKWKRFLKKFPEEVHPFIDGITDVVADGHCGFRAISLYRYGDEKNYPMVRQDLMHEMSASKDLYLNMLGAKSEYDLTRGALCAPSCAVSDEKWLRLPEMGHLIVNKYNVALVSIGKTIGQCCTYLPYRASTNPSSSKLWVIGNIDGVHWVQVHWKENAPLPKLFPGWKHNAIELALSWGPYFRNRLNTFLPMLPDRYVDEKVQNLSSDDEDYMT